MSEKTLSSLQQLNVDLCAALGITDCTNLQRVELLVRAGHLPQVTATFMLRSAAGLHEVMQRSVLTVADAAIGQQETRDAA